MLSVFFAQGVPQPLPTLVAALKQFGHCFVLHMSVVRLECHLSSCLLKGANSGRRALPHCLPSGLCSIRSPERAKMGLRPGMKRPEQPVAPCLLPWAAAEGQEA